MSTAVGKLRQGAAAGLGGLIPPPSPWCWGGGQPALAPSCPSSRGQAPREGGRGGLGAKLGVLGHPEIVPTAPPSSTPTPGATTRHSPSPPRRSLQEAEGRQGEPAPGKVQAPVVAVLQPLQLQQGQAHLQGQGTELALGSRGEEGRGILGNGLPPSPGGRSRSGGSWRCCRGRRRRGGKCHRQQGRDSAPAAEGGRAIPCAPQQQHVRLRRGESHESLLLAQGRRIHSGHIPVIPPGARPGPWVPLAALSPPLD